MGKPQPSSKTRKLISDCWTSPPERMLRKAFAKVWMMWRALAHVRRERHLMKSAANTAYRVELTARAVSDLEALYLEKNAAESPDAARWYNGLEQAVYT